MLALDRKSVTLFGLVFTLLGESAATWKRGAGE